MPPNNESSSMQVMNPLIGPALTSRTSVHCLTTEPHLKKIRLSGSFHTDEMADVKPSATLPPGESKENRRVLVKDSPVPASSTSALKAEENLNATTPDKPGKVESCGSDPPKKSGGDDDPSQPKIPTTFMHLKNKYHGELTYMLREFEKLERQLLGARKTEESKGSKDRREKLHSFIIHLQETIEQIEAGVQQHQTVGSTAGGTKEDAKTQAETAKTQAETVQKLEEHILANLLPVKVRLKKQLAAQQGAKHNPVGMPRSGAWTQRTDGGAKGTFAAAAERRRKEAEEAACIQPREPAEPVEPHQTQFGKPITEGGSSLTKKLHGETLGNKNEATRQAPVKAEPEAKTYYGGMALGSDQIESSVTAASSVHKLIIRDAEVMMKNNRASQTKEKEDTPPPPPPPQKEPAPVSEEKLPPPPTPPPTAAATATTATPATRTEAQHEPKPDLEEMERRRRRRRRRRKRQREQELKGVLLGDSETPKTREKKSRPAKKQRGPRQVEYICALCNEVYSSTCEFNPWWALTQQDCPKCRKTQVPKVDISAPANAIEYHPALLAHADDSAANQPPPPPPPPPDTEAVASEAPADDAVSLGSDVSSGLDDVPTDAEDSMDVDSDGDDSATMTPADKAENEHFGPQYAGPKLEERDASRLLVLMAHASTCSGRHVNEKQRDVCRSIRWMMLHVRDCPGTTSTYDICPFPWCRKVKHLLYHLVSCTDGDQCSICSGAGISGNLHNLKTMNEHRLQDYKEHLCQRVSGQGTVAPSGSRVSQSTATPKSPISPQRKASGSPAASAKQTDPAIKKENTASSDQTTERSCAPMTDPAINAQNTVVVAQNAPTSVALSPVADAKPAALVAIPVQAPALDANITNSVVAAGVETTPESVAGAALAAAEDADVPVGAAETALVAEMAASIADSLAHTNSPAIQSESTTALVAASLVAAAAVKQESPAPVSIQTSTQVALPEPQTAPSTDTRTMNTAVKSEDHADLANVKKE